MQKKFKMANWQCLNRSRVSDTRKLCYRKDDRPRNAPHIYGCPENFRDSLTMPTVTFPKIFHGLLFKFTLWMCVQNLKSAALPDPDFWDNWGTQKFEQSLDMPMLPLLKKFLMGFSSDASYECSLPVKLKVRSFTGSWDNRGYTKNWALPGYAHAPSCPKFLMGFSSDASYECTWQIISP